MRKIMSAAALSCFVWLQTAPGAHAQAIDTPPLLDGTKVTYYYQNGWGAHVEFGLRRLKTDRKRCSQSALDCTRPKPSDLTGAAFTLQILSNLEPIFSPMSVMLHRMVERRGTDYGRR